jgi:hypothetical protein
MVACFGVEAVQGEDATIRNHNFPRSECFLHELDEATVILSSPVCDYGVSFLLANARTLGCELTTSHYTAVCKIGRAKVTDEVSQSLLIKEWHGMQRGHDLSSDPNDPKVMDSCRVAISRARTEKSIVDRVAYLCELVAGKSALDIGLVEQGRCTTSRDWLYGHLKRRAASA